MNILVTGVGAIIGYGIINSLRQINQGNIRVIGMDIYEDAYGKFLCDNFYVAERADSNSYLEFICNVVKRESIDLIIPGIEQDMYRLFELRESVPAQIVLNNELLISISKDKWLTYKYFSEHSNLSLVPTLSQATFDECTAQLGVPFLLKPRSSYASKGLHYIQTRREFEFYNETPERNIFQRVVGSMDEEYTVSVFGDGYGRWVDYIILRRKLAHSGATDKAEVVDDSQILDYVSEICKLTKPQGPTNIQLRKSDDKVYLLEINPRISSACSIRTQAGYNEPKLCLIKYLNMNIPYNPISKRKIRAVRYISDFIYE